MVAEQEGRSFRTAVDDDAAGFDRELNLQMDNVIVVDCIPVIPPEKVPKLVSVLVSLYSKVGKIAQDGEANSVWMPMKEDGSETKGFAFIEFEDKKVAALAVQQTEGYKLDKSHVFRVYQLSWIRPVVDRWWTGGRTGGRGLLEQRPQTGGIEIR